MQENQGYLTEVAVDLPGTSFSAKFLQFQDLYNFIFDPKNEVTCNQNHRTSSHKLVCISKNGTRYCYEEFFL